MKTRRITSGKANRNSYPTNTRRTAATLALGVMLLQLNPITTIAAPTSPESKGTLGKVALVYGGTMPEFDLQLPYTRSEVADDTTAKICPPWWAALNEGCVRNELESIMALASAAFTPVAMGIGRIHGGIAGLPEKKVDATSLVLANAMTELGVENALRAQLMHLVWEKKPTAITVLRNDFPPESEFWVPSVMDKYIPIPASMAIAPRQGDLCASLSRDGFAQLMMLRVINHGLSGKHGRNSPLTVNMTVRVTFIHTEDASQGDSFYAQFESDPRKFVDWAANNAQPFRIDFERGLQSIASQVVTRIPATPPGPVELADASER